jgi:selenocysteine lyase/cysteine desulfurase
MLKDLYSRFLSHHPNTLHFASHSHHYWPDVTREAHLQYWDDSAKWVDKKWNYFYSAVLPQVYQQLCSHLNIPFKDNIVFAPNTHELIFRLISSFDWKLKIKVLTTDSEFYSFQRQSERLRELGIFEVDIIPTEPFATFENRFIEAAQKKSYDFIFFSQVFFNSGFHCDFKKIADNIPPEPIVCIDGYHGFFACPTDLNSIYERCFYVTGSYKYVQGGEGACFMVVPPSTTLKPFYTGWYAEISTLHAKDDSVPYPKNAQQFAGSTMDFSAIYRLRAVLNLFKEKNITVEMIDSLIKKNMALFINSLTNLRIKDFNMQNIRLHSLDRHGHFLTFHLPNEEITHKYVEAMNKKGLEVDSRNNRIRFGFGLYQDEQDIEKALNILTSI